MITLLEVAAEGVHKGASVPWWLMIPFVLMLLAIALGPILVHHWWEKNRNKLLVSAVLGIPTAIVLIIIGGYEGGFEPLKHQILFDYVPFIVLLLGLFVPTGGIHLGGDIKATPAVNTLFLAIGAVIASFMGTTGAAMLLIRPLIATNRERKHKVHTILFFIAIVANCGGLLTPMGDPPLFLLYLKGAPFDWFFHMTPEWAIVNIILLAMYFIMDTFSVKREDPKDLIKDATERQPLRLTGALNFLWLAGVILAVALINEQRISAIRENHYLQFYREAIIILMVFCSLLTTKKQVRLNNRFSFYPVYEVAFLFIGIFVTMTPALLFLREHAMELGLKNPIEFYFATGLLSGFLDNAPTAMAFHAMAEGISGAGTVTHLVANIDPNILTGISMGAVFFGSMTYIGNGPNFMVKSIAEENGIKMPNFFRYMYRFSLIILLPIFTIVGFIFLFWM